MPNARSTMGVLLTLATLKPTEVRLTDTVVLALMNWISKGDRATHFFSLKILHPDPSSAARSFLERSEGNDTSEPLE